MRLSAALVVIPLLACSISPLSIDRASEEFYSQLRSGDIAHNPVRFWNTWDVEMRVLRSDGSILHLGHFTKYPLHPSTTRKSVVVGLERRGKIVRLQGRDVLQLLSESPCQNAAEAKLFSLALADPLMISLAGFPTIKTFEDKEEIVVSLQLPGFFTTMQTDSVETINTLSGRSIDFHWKDGVLASVVQHAWPALSVAEDLEVRAILDQYFVPRQRTLDQLLGYLKKSYAGPYPEFQRKGIDWRRTSEGVFSAISVEDFPKFQVWSCDFKVAEHTYSISGTNPSLLFEDCFFDLFYELRAIGPLTEMSVGAWAKFCELAASHDWLICAFGEGVSVSLSSSDTQTLDFMVNSDDEEVIGLLRISWTPEGQPVYKFIFS